MVPEARHTLGGYARRHGRPRAPPATSLLRRKRFVIVSRFGLRCFDGAAVGRLVNRVVNEPELIGDVLSTGLFFVAGVVRLRHSALGGTHTYACCDETCARGIRRDSGALLPSYRRPRHYRLQGRSAC